MKASKHVIPGREEGTRRPAPVPPRVLAASSAGAVAGATGAMDHASRAGRIDQRMERASRALEAGQYFEAERLALGALEMARTAEDWERMARVCLPLQEARRQKRQLAMDAGFRLVLRDPPRKAPDMRPGLRLLEPPCIGLDARRLRETADKKQSPMIIICREPVVRSGPRAGLWPIVGVSGQRESIGGPTGMITVRAYVAPPPLQDAEVPGLTWFLSAGEALGDAALARINPKDPAHYRVDDLLEFLDAVPDHEKLHQALAAACREALTAPPPEEPRRFRAFRQTGW